MPPTNRPPISLSPRVVVFDYGEVISRAPSEADRAALVARAGADESAFWPAYWERRDELDQLREILRRRRWFFLKVSGRRRIGKTSLVQEALKAELREKVLYIQIPDSEPAGVVSAAREFYDLFGVAEPLPVDLRSLAASIGELARRGFVVAVDEFQYFHRKALFEFTSHLQIEVDRLAADAANRLSPLSRSAWGGVSTWSTARRPAGAPPAPPRSRGSRGWRRAASGR